MFKKILNCLMVFFIGIIVGTMLITIINYFNIFGVKIVRGLKFILPSVMMVVSSYRLGKMSNKKGYLEGLKLSGIIVLVFAMLVLLLDKFSLKCLLYYGILTLMGVMGSMIGINRRKTNAWLGKSVTVHS